MADAAARSRAAAVRRPAVPSAKGTSANTVEQAMSAIIAVTPALDCAMLPTNLTPTAAITTYVAVTAVGHATNAQIVPSTTNGPSQNTVASSMGLPFQAIGHSATASRTPSAAIELSTRRRRRSDDPIACPATRNPGRTARIIALGVHHVATTACA